MPKYREDLIHPAFRIIEAIAANNWTAQPPHVRVDFTPIFGFAVLEIKRPFRIREPFRSVRLEKKKGRQHNRTTVPTSYLCMRWIDLRVDSPLWYLTALDFKERAAKGVFFDSEEQQWKLLTYQVVTDSNHLRRMFVHIFARYQLERSAREAMLQRIEQEVAQAVVFGPALSPASRREMGQFTNWVDRRLEDMGNITGKLGGRADLVHYHAQRVGAVLFGIARTLRLDANNLLRGSPFSLPNFKTHLEIERLKLDRLVSRNILPLRRAAQRRIVKAVGFLDTDQQQSALALFSAADKLDQAAESMKRWADSIPSEEMTAAKTYRGFD